MLFAELHCKTNFSFLEGASHAHELVERAVALGYAALAITDRNSLAGIVRAHRAVKEQAHAQETPRRSGFKLIVGAEITLTDGLPLVLWVTDRAAYGRLARLITVGRRRAPKGECHLTFADVAAHADGLLAGLVTSGSRPGGDAPRFAATAPDEAGCGPVNSSAAGCRTIAPAGSIAPAHNNSPAQTRPYRLALSADELARFRDVFGDRAYLLASLHRGPHDQGELHELIDQSARSRLPLLATGNVLYHVPARMPLHDVLTAVRHGVTVAAAGDLLLPNAQRHLRAVDDIRVTFAQAPDCVRRTMEVASRCTFSLDELRYEYPEELAPRGLTPHQFLQQLTWAGAAKRYPRGVPNRVRQLVEHELALIQELHYEAYFLTVWDLVHFARRRGILCQGRGSAANSAVCYCLGVTSVDPDRMDLLFERFVSRERNEPPDIDVDFEHERREEVLQYLYEKYGRERVGMTGVVITYRLRSAIRDVGKALGLSLDRVDQLAKHVEGHAEEPKFVERCREVGIAPDSDTGRRFVHLVHELLGFPRHLSQHVGGMVITQGLLCELVPIENAAMAGRTVIQWDKDDLDSLGLLKVDCLALGMLTAIHRCFDMVARWHDRKLTLATVPADDARVYDMICRADTAGVFQIESRGQMSMLPRLKPRCFYDLVIEVAIVRPGPIQGNMVHPYLRRRAGLEPVAYPNEAVREVLHKTLGVPIFQEQAMRLAVVAAGFSPGEADQLRRAMGAWRRPGVIDGFRKKLLEGMQARGLAPEFAEQVFQQIRGFGEYGFPESHAASFALLVYVSAWLKRYYPAAFTAALINSQPMGFYAPAQLVQDARRHAVRILPVDVNFSDWDCTLEPLDNPPPQDAGAGGNHPATTDPPTDASQTALRLGFRLLNGIPQAAALEICQVRQTGGIFRSLADFSRRITIGRALMVRLSEADVFQSLHASRRHALWDALAQNPSEKPLPLLDDLAPEDEPPAPLPAMSAQEEVLADYLTAGLSLKAHPLAFFRHALDRMNVLTADKLPTLQNHRRVRVAGLVLLRQRPSTAKGITFATLEDETGTANLLIHMSTWDRYYHVARHASAWLAHGRIESRDSVVHVIVQQLEDLSNCLSHVRVPSRDFR